MNPAVKHLIPAVVCYIVEHGSYVTKTKLLKLLYLFDVEHYRLHRRTYTGFQWKFFHLGPWTAEFEPLLNELVGEGVLVETTSARAEFDTKFYRAVEPADLSKLFERWREEAALKSVLDTWGDSSTAEILNHVYFHTEPMEHGVRNEPLDFRVIAEEAPPRYRRSTSGKTPGEMAALRRKFRETVARMVVGQEKEFAATPPRYDAEFFDAISKLNRP